MPIQVTTDLPDEDAPQLGNGVEDEVAVDRESAVSNYGSVRIQIRETGQSSWDSTAEGFGEFIGAYDTLSMEFVGREDGEQYEVRARTETEHRTGNWTTPVSIVTKFPGVTDLSVVDTGSEYLTLEGTDNADNEAGIRVWRRDERDPLQQDTDFSEWHLVDDIDPNPGTGPFQFTDDTVDQNHDYEYYVEPYTPHTSADSGTAAATTDVAVPNDGWFLKFEADTGEKATLSSNSLDSSRPQLQPEKSAVARWQVDIRADARLRDWLFSEAYIYYNGSLWMRGPYTRYLSDGGSSDGSAKLEGLGVCEYLNQGGAAFSATSEPGYEAFRRFVEERLDDWTATVTPPASNTINEDFVVQTASSSSEFETVFAGELTDEAPVDVEDDGKLTPLPVCETKEGENPDGSSFTGSDPAYSGGASAHFEAVGESITWTFNWPYTLSADHVGLAIRDEITSSDGAEGLSWYFNGEQIDEISPSGDIPLSWKEISDEGYYGGPNFEGYTGNALEPGTDYSLKVEADSSGDPTGYEIDMVCIYDTRFIDPDDFDDDNGGNGNYLDGPPDYKPLTFVSEPFSQEFNIAAADVDATLNNTANAQRLQASNDGGGTWLPNDGSEQNTSLVTADFATTESYGTEIRGRVTLGGYGERDTATPRYGYQPQTLSEWEVRIDTNALRVIDDQTYTGSPFEILDSIREDAGLVFVPDYREDQLHLNAFAPGDEVRSVDWTVVDSNPVDTVEGYYNSITVFGAEQENGERLTATARSQAAIDERGEVPGAAEFAPDAETEAELISRARARLAEGLAADTVTGQLTIESQFVQPGYAYEVDEFDAEGPFVLEDATFEWGEMTLDFEGRESLARALRSVETEIRTTKRAL